MLIRVKADFEEDERRDYEEVILISELEARWYFILSVDPLWYLRRRQDNEANWDLLMREAAGSEDEICNFLASYKMVLHERDFSGKICSRQLQIQITALKLP